MPLLASSRSENSFGRLLMFTPYESTPVYQYGVFPSKSDDSPLNPRTPPYELTEVD